MRKSSVSLYSATSSDFEFAPHDLFPAAKPDRARSAPVAKLGLALVLGLLPTLAVNAQEKPADQSTEPRSLATTVVTGVTRPETAQSADLAAVTLAEVPGAVSLVTSAQVEKGRVGTSADILAFTPGVFAAPPAGSGDGIKLSIRGSAIARTAGNFFRSGTLFTFDGLPVTGAGGTPYELFETYGLNYTEVLLGGNAFDYGALQLGGAINYVTKTGYDASPFEVRLDFGSFGYRKLQVSSGQVVGNADYFISVASLRVDGYNDHAQGKATGFAGNFGYRLSPKISTRFFLRYLTTENANPGSISLNELNANSRQANPNNITNDTYRTQPGSTWIANRTNIQIDQNSKLELGFVFHDAPIDISPKPSSGNVGAPLADAERSIWTFRDLTLLAKYTRVDTLFGHQSTTTVAATVDREFDADVNVYANNANVTTGPRAFRNLLKTANYDGSEDSSVRVINEFALSEKLALSSGAAVAYIRRAGDVTYFRPDLPPFAAAPGAAGREIDRDNYYFAPRLGLRYDLDSRVTLFANVTRSVEAPNSWQLNRGSQGNYQYQDNIRDQRAVAFEIGGRVHAGAYTGSLVLFRTNVKDELLSIPIVPGDPSKGSYTFNGSDTYKQGVELGLDAVLWSEKGFLVAAPTGRSSKLVLSQSLSLNDFGYKDDPTFGKNELPGVPRQYYQGRLQYDHVSGFYASATLQYASRYYVDFRNQLEAPAYVLLGASIGYQDPKNHWQVYLDARNITDQKYASSAGPVFDAGPIATNRTNRLFQAGDGFGIFGGLTLKL
jgi:iron complex outermembrane recepter protein